MYKNKIIQALSVLSQEEWRGLDKFVCSPVHNKHEKVTRLFRYLRKHLPEKADRLHPEKLFHHLFPGEPIDMSKVHHISSYLLKVTEEYLAWKQWRQDEQAYQFYLLQAFHDHQQPTAFKKHLTRLEKSQKKDSIRDADHLRFSYVLEKERFAHTRTVSKARAFRLQELSDSLDLAYIAEKLKTACILLSNQAVTKTEYDLGLLEQVLDGFEEKPYLQTPAVSVYYYAYRTLSDFKDDASFLELKQRLAKYSRHFQSAELYDIYIFAINYCIRRSNKGDREFINEIFYLYKTGMESEVFIQNDTIPPRTYSNIVMSGLRMKDFDWIEDFIYRYRDALPEKQRDGFFNYNLARFYFHKNDYQKAMPLLLQMEYNDVLLNCLGKILLTQMYYEQEETEALISLLQSFKTYIRRKKMLGYHRESYLNFIQLVGKMMHQQEAEVIRQDIENTKVLAEREWLLEQLK